MPYPSSELREQLLSFIQCRKLVWRRPFHLHAGRIQAMAFPRAEDVDLHSRLSRPPISKAALEDPANIGSSYSCDVAVRDEGGDLSLSSYMQLPVEQYYELDPKMIKPLGGRRFALCVPRVELLGVWVEPLVEIRAIHHASYVLLKAANCRINGSDLVSRLNLDQRFCVEFQTTLTWMPAPATLQQNAAAAAPVPLQNGQDSSWLQWPFSWQGSSESEPWQGRVKAEAKLDVWSEVLTPFNLMPRPLLQSSGSAVMAALIRSLLPLFVRKLTEDYRKWATEPDYRRRRAVDSRISVGSGKR